MTTLRAKTQILNETKGCVLHESPEWALSLWQQAKGLMFSAPRDRAMIFFFMPSRRVRLHMWFVFAPIDVIALDSGRKVIAIKEQFRPWSYWDAGLKASVVIELPSGTVAKTETCKGDLIGIPAPPIRRGK